MSELTAFWFSLNQLSGLTAKIAGATLHFLSSQMLDLAAVTVGATFNIMTLNTTLKNELTVCWLLQLSELHYTFYPVNPLDHFNY